MAAKKGNALPPEKFIQYQKLVATNPKVDLKGDTMPYTAHNGHMFSNFNPDGTLGLRLPPEAIEDFIKKYKSELVNVFGIVRKEYVVVPDNLLKNTKELTPYFKMSFAYVDSLKPKATKK